MGCGHQDVPRHTAGAGHDGQSASARGRAAGRCGGLGQSRGQVGDRAWEDLTYKTLGRPWDALKPLTLVGPCPPPVQVKDDLGRARDAFVMSSDLHITFLCTPIQNAELKIDWAK